MRRFHVHVRVADLEQSIGFYSTLFGLSPTVLKPDYAKWMLDDPRVNFAISANPVEAGLDHLGLQVGMPSPRKRTPRAAMPSAIRSGLLIRMESRGKPSTLSARTPYTEQTWRRSRN